MDFDCMDWRSTRLSGLLGIQTSGPSGFPKKKIPVQSWETQIAKVDGADGAKQLIPDGKLT